jgi:Fe-S-cluster-containing dehydrogenase component/DMSO reductase anchor subunit
LTVTTGTPRTPGLLTLIEECLAEQADLSAVERFSGRHDAGLLPEAGRWRDLLPATGPGPGQQYGFEVDLDSCTGCKACVTACRSLNGLDEDESWRTVGVLHGGSSPSFRGHPEPRGLRGHPEPRGLRGHPDPRGFRGHPEPRGSHLQTVTATCHHCVEPACLAGCPVDAYEKHPVTGIVRHLDDQCIGCGYCTFTCPYDVPRYNPARGIVRKCDMCSDRLSAGEPPACAQACPNGAIRVVVVEVEETRRRAVAEGALVPGAPPSSLTVPTTRYHSARGLPTGLAPAGRFALRPAQPHPPLAVMLVLTQLSAGAFGADLALRALAGEQVAATLRPANALVALGLGLLALAASVAHLGRPLQAWRAVIGLRHSWLSREIVAFSAFAALAVAYAGALWFGPAQPVAAVDGLGFLVAAVGAFGVGCSVMIYAVTGRAWWRRNRTALRFALTAAGCGLATTLATSLAGALARGGDAPARAAAAVPLALMVAGVVGLKLAWEGAFLLRIRGRGAPEDDLDRSARLLLGPELGGLTRWRFGLGLLGGVALPLVVAALCAAPGPSIGAAAILAAVAALGVVAGELCERAGFFAAVTSPSMPRELP